MKRSTKPMKKSRSKPRPGRLKGKDMETLRRDCFERDGYRCQHRTYLSLMGGELWEVCMKPVTWETGHMAHIVSRGRGGKDELSNVLTKCAECHMIREHHEGNGGKIVPRKLGGAE